MANLIIGLGNPGGEYAGTRHNLGWMVLEEMGRRGRFSRARREGQAKVRTGSLDGFDLVLAQPTTYMNLSGRAAAHLVRVLGVLPTDVVAVHDELDIAFGRLHLKRGGSAGGHRGVISLIESFQTPEFIRVRVGIGRPPPGVDPIDFDLSPFTPAEREALPEIIGRASDAVLAIVRDGLDRAMSEYNRRPTQAPVDGRVPASGD